MLMYFYIATLLYQHFRLLIRFIIPAYGCTRSSLIHFACIGFASPQLVLQRDQLRGTTPMQLKSIKLDLWLQGVRMMAALSYILRFCNHLTIVYHYDCMVL